MFVRIDFKRVIRSAVTENGSVTTRTYEFFKDIRGTESEEFFLQMRIRNSWFLQTVTNTMATAFHRS
jgi:hypothetical protein